MATPEQERFAKQLEKLTKQAGKTADALRDLLLATEPLAALAKKFNESAQ